MKRRFSLPGDVRFNDLSSVIRPRAPYKELSYFGHTIFVSMTSRRSSGRAPLTEWVCDAFKVDKVSMTSRRSSGRAPAAKTKAEKEKKYVSMTSRRSSGRAPVLLKRLPQEDHFGFNDLSSVIRPRAIAHTGAHVNFF